MSDRLATSAFQSFWSAFSAARSSIARTSTPIGVDRISTIVARDAPFPGADRTPMSCLRLTARIPPLRPSTHGKPTTMRSPKVHLPSSDHGVVRANFVSHSVAARGWLSCCCTEKFCCTGSPRNAVVFPKRMGKPNVVCGGTLGHGRRSSLRHRTDLGG